MNNFLKSPDGDSGSAKAKQRKAKFGRDQTVSYGSPQADGTPAINPGLRPTKAGTIQGSASPMAGRSGMETALGALADKLHPPKRR